MELACTRHCEVLIFLGLGTCKTKRPPIHSRTNSLTLPLQSWRRNILPLPANPPISHGRCHPSGGITAADNKKIHRWKKDNRHQEKLSSRHFQSSSPCHLVFVHAISSSSIQPNPTTHQPSNQPSPPTPSSKPLRVPAITQSPSQNLHLATACSTNLPLQSTSHPRWHLRHSRLVRCRGAGERVLVACIWMPVSR